MSIVRLTCRICNSSAKQGDEILLPKGHKWEIFPLTPIHVCKSCLKLWIDGNIDTLERRFNKKLEKLENGELR